MSSNAHRTDTDLDEAFKSYVARLYPGEAEISYQKQADAFNKIKISLATEKNPFIKDFMRETVLWLCNQDMQFTYFLEQRWEDDVQEQRDAFEELEALDVFYLVEKILASSSSSYGYTKNESYSRYPLIVPGYQEGEEKTRYVANGQFAPSRILRSYYKFGVHTFYAGRAVSTLQMMFMNLSIGMSSFLKISQSGWLSGFNETVV